MQWFITTNERAVNIICFLHHLSRHVDPVPGAIFITNLNRPTSHTFGNFSLHGLKCIQWTGVFNCCPCFHTFKAIPSIPFCWTVQLIIFQWRVNVWRCYWSMMVLNYTSCREWSYNSPSSFCLDNDWLQHLTASLQQVRNVSYVSYVNNDH